MSRQQIDPKKAPILWDTVNEAFDKINSNFVELYLSLGSGGAVDLTDLSTSISPSTTEVYNLGSPTKRWKDLYLSGSTIYLGNAVITASGGAVNLPAGSTIAGSVLDNEYFREIAVAGQTNIVADAGGNDILTIAAGNSGITLTTNAGTDTLTISNSGVTGITTGAGISVNQSTGPVVITNIGVTGLSAGTGIGVSGPNGSVTIQNTGVTRLEAGGGITLDVNTGTVTVTNNSPNIVQNLWRFIAVTGYTNLDPVSASATLTFEAGNGMNVQSSLAQNKLTFINTGVTSLGVGAGISASGATGSVTLTNTGVTSLGAGDGISVSASTGGVTITNTRPGFTNIAVQGQSPIQADATSDTLVLIAGEGIELIADPVTDSLIIAAEANIKTSIFGENSTLLVDSVNSRIVGPIDTSSLRTSEGEIRLGLRAGEIAQAQNTVAVGRDAGYDTQGLGAIAVGTNAGQNDQGTYAVAIGTGSGLGLQGSYAVAVGTGAGRDNQGANAVAIGSQAGQVNQSANSIIINASGAALNGAAAGLYVAPIRELSGPQALYYDPTGKEITWGPIPAGSGGSGGGGGDFELNVAADDSTLIRVNSGETLKFVGTGGITTTSNAEGQITISGAALTSLAGRGDVFGTTGSLINSATGNLSITGFKGYMMYKIATSAAAWIRIYTSTAARTADSSRAEGTDPSPGAGVIAEVVTTGAETVLLSPGVIGFNNESIPTNSIEVAVTNKSGGTRTITVTLTVVKLEN